MRRVKSFTCQWCGKVAAARADHVERGRVKYCSAECGRLGRARALSEANQGKTGELNHNWKGGVSQDSYRYRLRMKAKYPEKYKARRVTEKAILSGQLVPQPCPCGCLDVQAHHDDYSKPLEIRWLCCKCHSEHHGRPTGSHTYRVGESVPTMKRESNRAYVNRIRAERRAAGLCAYCGKRPPIENMSRCGPCMVDHREEYRKTHGCKRTHRAKSRVFEQQQKQRAAVE